MPEVPKAKQTLLLCPSPPVVAALLSKAMSPRAGPRSSAEAQSSLPVPPEPQFVALLMVRFKVPAPPPLPGKVPICRP